MPGGGSKTQTTNTKQESTPWAPAIPAATNIVNRANGLLDSGAGSAVYGGQRTAGLGSDTQAGLDMLKSGAQAGVGVAQSGAGFVNGLTASGGTTAATRDATAGLAGIDTTVNRGGTSAIVGKLSDPNNVAATTGAALAGGSYATDTKPVAGLAAGLASGSSQTQRSSRTSPTASTSTPAIPIWNRSSPAERTRPAPPSRSVSPPPVATAPAGSPGPSPTPPTGSAPKRGMPITALSGVARPRRRPPSTRPKTPAQASPAR
ncbi:hypothetical protein ACFQWF_19315 [Methylorubrum suomiense]